LCRQLLLLLLLLAHHSCRLAQREQEDQGALLAMRLTRPLIPVSAR
jgi:hypothetical protein